MRLVSKIVVALLLALFAPITFAVSYPQASPNKYYLLPGQTLSISGSQFAPHESIAVSGPAGTSYINAGANGAFVKTFTTVPYSSKNSAQKYTVSGSQSAYTIPITVTIGSFYPQVSPSSYYVTYNQAMIANLKGFAPGERVELYVAGEKSNTLQVGTTGSAAVQFRAPKSGSKFLLYAYGLSSGTSNSKTVYLH